MNTLDSIRAFVNQQVHATGPAANTTVAANESILTTLTMLADNNEWLSELTLVERVVSRLEDFEPQSPEEHATVAAVYMKIMNPALLPSTVAMRNVQIKVSDRKSFVLPKGSLIAKSRAFQQRLNEMSMIDLSRQASESTLLNFVSYLQTGKTDCVTDENATELLFLARAYELTQLSMSCLQHMLDNNNRWPPASGSGREISKEQNELLDLIETARAYFTQASSHNGILHISIDGHAKEHWNCLKKLHDFIPITHLKIKEDVCPDLLMDFLNHNPNIESLILTNGGKLKDNSFEQLSDRLTKLRSLTIHSKRITHIPQSISKRLTMLDCSYCSLLTRVEAPNAIEVYCNYCDKLTDIQAPTATTLHCHNNRSLALIATNATELICNGCEVLASIHAPNAIELLCERCPVIEELTAPNAKTVVCSSCKSLISIEAPSAIDLSCQSCHKLKWIVAPSVTTLVCTCCTALEHLSTNAKSILCFFCEALKTIEAPNAKELTCHDCTSLISLKTSATKINCCGCHALTEIQAPNVTKLNCYFCIALTEEATSKLFNTVRNHTLIAHFANPESLMTRLDDLFLIANPMYRLKEIVQAPLNWWLNDTLKLHTPLHFKSEIEKLQYESLLDNQLDKLIALTHPESAAQRGALSLSRKLRKPNSLQQKRNRMVWLGCLIAVGTTRETPLADPDTLPLLTAIGNLSNPILQAGATRMLLSADHANAIGFDQKMVWKRLHDSQMDHLLLPCLLLQCVGIGTEKIEELLKQLKPKHYADNKILDPMLEAIYMLSKDRSVPAAEREKVLTLILEAPPKSQRENEKRFAERTSAYRIKQQKWIAACQGLLLFKHGHILIGLKNADDLMDKHKRVCQTIFGVEEEHHLTFINTFKSERYPNGLFTYAARLQTLPSDEKTLLTKLLGKFINGHLEGVFPGSRYDQAVNPHLRAIFKDNTALLEKWKDPLNTSLAQAESPPTDLHRNCLDAIKEQMRQAVNDRHLGDEQESQYPLLCQACASDDRGAIQKSLTELTSQKKDLQEQQDTVTVEHKKRLIDKLRCLEIEIYCLKVLDPRAETQTKIDCLNALLRKLPKDLEFKHNVHGMLKTLDTTKPPTTKWIKLQTTEHWEDFLLTGSEVSNSCQRIDGDPKLNKCLLAYILDGKNQLVIVRDSEGKIAARSVLRILWNSEHNCPVLFMERVYTSTVDPTLTNLIIKGCTEKAEMMGLCLVAHAECFPQGRPYNGSLQALGGPAPFEYVDALGGIQKNGVFTIHGGHVIYTPGEGPAAGERVPI